MKIGIDLDEVIGHFLPALIKYHNITYQTNYKIADFNSYHFWDVWGGNREQAIQKTYDFHQTPYFKNIKPIAGAKAAIKKLKKGNDLFIITSRQTDVKAETKKWLQKYFPDCFKKVYFTNDFSQKGPSKTKKDVCAKLKIDIMVEDSAKYANECASPNRKIFLINQPWNIAEKIQPGIIRVNSWAEILKKI